MNGDTSTGPYDLDALLGEWATATALSDGDAARLLATVTADRVVTLDAHWWKRHNRRLAGTLARAHRSPLAPARRAA